MFTPIGLKEKIAYEKCLLYLYIKNILDNFNIALLILKVS